MTLVSSFERVSTTWVSSPEQKGQRIGFGQA
jgi:hypothetical protein